MSTHVQKREGLQWKSFMERSGIKIEMKSPTRSFYAGSRPKTKNPHIAVRV
jgi:hypothetical protein